MKFTDGLKVKGVIAMKQEEITELKQYKWSTFVSRIDFKEREPTSLNFRVLVIKCWISVEKVYDIRKRFFEL